MENAGIPDAFRIFGAKEPAQNLSPGFLAESGGAASAKLPTMQALSVDRTIAEYDRGIWEK
ncbi:MAG: hypothetical protein MR913_03260 [Clostridiales bacterium]|nr:hypothetical protein [Clostridiales bacterium]